MTKKIEKSPDIAIDAAIQTTKLFIALATSVLAFTVTFAEKMNENGIFWQVKISWIFLAISIIAGVIVLQKIIGELVKNGSVSLYKCSIKWSSIIQNLFFVVGILWVAFFMVLK